jgi:hypothetical protein
MANLRPLLLLTLLACTPLRASAQSQPDDLQQQLVRAQIDYYRAQSAPQTFWQLLFSSLPSLIGTGFGALVALGGVYVSSKIQWKQEQQKWQKSSEDELERWKRAQQDDLVKWERSQAEAAERREQNRQDEILRESRLAVAELARRIAAAGQSFEALLWTAKFEPTRFSYDHVAAHDKTMSTIYTEMTGAQIVVAALNPSLYEKVAPIVNEVYKTDAIIAGLANSLEQNPSKVSDLGDLWPQATIFSKDLPKRILGILSLSEGAKKNT